MTRTLLAALMMLCAGVIGVPTARADWYLAKIGGQTCVPLEEVGIDGFYHSARLGMIHTPEEYMFALAGRPFPITPEPNTPVGIIEYKIGEGIIMFFSNRQSCIYALSTVSHN